MVCKQGLLPDFTFVMWLQTVMADHADKTFRLCLACKHLEFQEALTKAISTTWFISISSIFLTHLYTLTVVFFWLYDLGINCKYLIQTSLLKRL